AGPPRPAPVPPPVPAVAVRSTAATYRPLGTWYKEVPGAVLALTFGDGLTVTSTQDYGNGPVVSTITADYAVTPGGTVHGVVTGTDADTAGNQAADPWNHATLAARLQEGVDQAFAFRCRPTAGGLMVSNTTFQLAIKDGGDPPGCTFDGRYTFAPDGKVPAPKPATVAKTAPQVVLPPAPAVYAQPVVVESAPLPVACPQPAVAAVTYAVPPLPPIPPLPSTTVMVAPAAPAVAVGRTNGLPVGTWFREVGPVRMTLAVQDGTLSLTTTMTAEVEGKSITQGLVVTADCYTTRDGLVGVVTGADVVFEGELPAGLAAEVAKGMAEVGKIQKALADKPFALSCRVVDGCLMVGNVRLAVPKLDGGAFDGLEDGSLIAGRYKPAGENGPPTQQAVKVVEETTLNATLPSPRYLEHHPPYFAPDPSFPLPRELAAQTEVVPACAVAPEPREVVKAAACEHVCPAAGVCPAGVRACVEGPARMTLADVMTLAKAGLGDEVIVTQLRLTGSTFSLTTADLVALKRAGVSDRVIVTMQIGEDDQPQHLTPERIHGGVSYSADPNVRVECLLDASADLRQASEQRLWFYSHPVYLGTDWLYGGFSSGIGPWTPPRKVWWYTGLIGGI
ncbi:MAG: hypothetical protein K2X87_15010, partial [Gemmataceae bacterium]|nr:hypothetical protein [Gemmataceae bacterium]